MACEVEVINGPDLTEKDSFRDNDSENEILTLKQSLKEKLHNDTINGTVNGSLNGASCSSSSSSVNNIETVENGHSEEKHGSDVNQETTSKRQTPKKSNKGKRVKAKKLSKSKKQPPAKKLDVTVEEESTRSEQSWNSAESVNKDTEDDNSTIDVVGENDEPGVVDDIDVSIEDEIRTEISEEKPEEVKVDSSVFSRIRNSMRFSVSPRKQTFTSCSSSEGSSSYGSSFDNKESQYHFRGISGRRALHHSSFPLESREAETLFSQNLKRKAQSESPEAPQRKHFITSLTERSPGWKFFSSPFSHFWTPNKKSMDVTVSSSTPLRKLHEDVNVEDSMAVNVDESVEISFIEEMDVGKENIEKEEKGSIPDIPFAPEDKESVQTNWRCIVM